METRYTYAPLVIGKNKKNFEILPLKRVKFEIFAWVIG